EVLVAALVDDTDAAAAYLAEHLVAAGRVAHCPRRVVDVQHRVGRAGRIRQLDALHHQRPQHAGARRTAVAAERSAQARGHRVTRLEGTHSGSCSIAAYIPSPPPISGRRSYRLPRW